MQIKKCAEMARKLRFFREQMSKAGLSPSMKLMTQVDIDMDDLEVYKENYHLFKLFFFLLYVYLMHAHAR